MKKIRLIISVVIISLFLSLGYLIKTYNPAGLSWKTSLVANFAKLTDIFYLPYLFKNNSLPVYQLTIKPDNYVALNQSLPNPAIQRTLIDQYTKVVPAKFTYNGQEYDVEVHYRGYDFDHWARQKKSWRIKFNDSQPFFGQTDIDLVIIGDRGIYLEALSNFRARKFNLLSLPDQYVILEVNNQTQGVYWQFEHWSSALLERQQLPVGNLYGEVAQPAKREQQQSIFTSINHWKKYTQDEIYQDDNYAEIALLLDLLNNSSDEEFFTRLSHILDMESFISWQAHSVLMDSNHQDSTHNIRLYWHPALGKFYIFPWDVLGGYGWPVNYNPLVSRVLKNPEWLAKRNQILKDYVSDPNNLKDDLEYYDHLIAQTRTAIFQDYRKFFSNYGYVRQTEKFRREIINQFQLIKSKLEANDLPDETSGFSFPSADPVKVTVVGKSVIEDEFKDFDKLFIPQPAVVKFSPGNHLLTETLIIQPGHSLVLSPGAKLIMGKGISLVSFGPVEAVGTAANPITLTAANSQDYWGVFAVVGQGAAGSQFKHLIVEYASQTVVNGTYFTGALAIHNVPGTIVEESLFRYNHGDDALNFKYNDGQVINNQFIDNEFDSLDFDFCGGEVSGNRLINNGNDGLDFGSASPLVKDNLVDIAGDKCISLGETSNPKILNNIFKNCNMGIAVKDSSQPEIINNQIIGNNIGLSSYLKKPIFPRQPFIFKDNVLVNNQVDFEEDDTSLRRESL